MEEGTYVPTAVCFRFPVAPSRLASGFQLTTLPSSAKRFARPSSLRIHIHSHTGEKPFDCNLCGRGFSVQVRFLPRFSLGCVSRPGADSGLLQSNLKRHLKIHQAEGKGGRTEKSSADEGEGSLGSEEESGQR